MQKQCRRCDVWRETTEFRKAPQNKDKLQSYCKYCQNILKEDWRQRNMGHYIAYAKQAYKDHPRRSKGRSLQKFFKCDWQTALKKYEEMLVNQNQRCAICKVHNSEITLTVDHCHNTGKVRGLLCHSCNLCLGRMKESIESFKAAIKYLENSY